MAPLTRRRPRRRSRPERARRTTPRPASITRAPAPLDQREQTERTFLALCIALPEVGREALRAVDPEEHFTSPLVRRAVLHLRDRVATPLADLPEEDPELVALISELVVRAGSEPASVSTLDVQKLQLEYARLERAIRGAQSRQEPARGDPRGGARAGARAAPRRAGVGAARGEHTFAFSVRPGRDHLRMDKDVLQGFLEDGLSLEEIGRRLGKHPSTVSYWVGKHGSAGCASRQARRLVAESPRETAARTCLARGMTIQEMADACWREQHERPALAEEVRSRRRAGAAASRRRGQRARRSAHGRPAPLLRRTASTDFGLEGRGHYRCLRCRWSASVVAGVA